MRVGIKYKKNSKTYWVNVNTDKTVYTPEEISELIADAITDMTMRKRKMKQYLSYRYGQKYIVKSKIEEMIKCMKT